VKLSLLLSVLLLSNVAWSAAPAPAAPPLAVVVHPPRTEGVALFSDELRQLHQATLRYLVRQDRHPLMPVPMKQLRALEELVSSRRHSVDGPVCMVGPSFSALAKERYPGAARAYPTASYGCREHRQEPEGALGSMLALAGSDGDPRHCPKAFKLSLRVARTREDGVTETLIDLSAEVPKPTDVKAWIAALDRLASADDRTMGLLGSLGRPPAGVLVDVTDAVIAGDWGRLRGFAVWDRPADTAGFGMGLRGLRGPDEPRPARKQKRKPQDLAGLLGGTSKALNDCHVGGRVFEAEALLSVDQRGRVQRCHAQSKAISVPNAHLSCVCTALSRPSFPRAKGPRRLTLSLYNRPGSPEEQRENGVLIYQRRPESDDPFLVRPSLEVAVQQIRYALRAGQPERELTLPVSLSVDPTGEVKQVKIEKLELIAAARRADLERAFAGTPFPCPQRGKATDVRLELKIGPMSKQTGLDGLLGPGLR